MPLPPDALQAFRPETVRGGPGYFRVAQMPDGSWTFLAVDGRPFFARAVNAVQAMTDSPRDPVARLRAWGFNVLGPGSSVELRQDGLAFVGTVDFAACGNTIRSEGIRLPDVFDSAWAGIALERAADICSRSAHDRDLLGWLSDDELIWGREATENRPSLLQVCLSLEPSFAAYHASWEFVLARHSGSLTGLAEGWEIAIENKEVVRERTRSDAAIMTEGYLADNHVWTDEFARRYFSTTSNAIRTHDPNHLLFGVRDALGYRRISGSRAWMSEGLAPAVDVAWVHPNVLDTAVNGPVFVGEFNWARQQPTTPTRRGSATRVERMLRHGRSRLRAVIQHPSVVGYAWDFWCDSPVDQPPFGRGLVHVNDNDACEHTELLSDLNARASQLRRRRKLPI